MEGDPRTYDLRTALRAVRRRAPLIIAVALAVAAGGFIYSLLAEKTYTAEATVLARDPNFAQRAFGSKVLLTQPQAPTPFKEAKLAELEEVAGRAAAKLGADGPSPSEIRDAVDVVTDADSSVLTVQAEWSTPQTAASIANAYAAAIVATRREANVAVIERARATAEQQLSKLDSGSPEAAQLQQTLAELETFEALQTGDVEQVHRAAAPADPSSPRTLTNTVGGGVAGLLLGIALALLLERARPVLGSRREVERLMGAPVLAELSGTSTPESQELRLLRTRLLHRAGAEPPRSLLVTPLADERAGELAANLADSAASGGIRCVLVDADIRADRDGGGLVALLEGDAARPDVVEIGAGGTRADRVASGRHADAAALLGRRDSAEALTALFESYELAVVSAPSPLREADAIPLLRLVDAVLVVVAADAELERCRELRETLASAGRPARGLVVVGSLARG